MNNKNTELPISEDEALKEIEKIISPTSKSNKKDELSIKKEFDVATEGTPNDLDITMPSKVLKKETVSKFRNPAIKRLKISRIDGKNHVYEITKEHILIRPDDSEDNGIAIPRDNFVDFFEEIKELKNMLIDEQIIRDPYEDYYES